MTELGTQNFQYFVPIGDCKSNKLEIKTIC